MAGRAPSAVPLTAEEEALWSRGCGLVAGVDEVGRGPLAGPVVAAAVILPPYPRASWLEGVRDSKALTPRAREALAPLIASLALTWAIGLATVEEVDTLGILSATRLAMRRAVEALHPRPLFLLVDGLALPEAGVPCKALKRGDARCLSIACASVLAKVWRDRLMVSLDARYPGYGFARHKGYATPQHRHALARLGPCPLHRRTFAPVREAHRG